MLNQLAKPWWKLKLGCVSLLVPLHSEGRGAKVPSKTPRGNGISLEQVSSAEARQSGDLLL